MKKKIISVIVGVAGLTMAYFLASGISHIIYNRPTDNAAAETESTTDSAVQGTEEAKSAMTENEINEMLAGMKTTETAETETATEEQSEVIPVKFEELQAVNPDVYAWITVPGTDIDYPILQQNSRVYRLKSPAGEETTEVTETEDSFAVLPVDVLTELIFGVKNPTELALEQETMQGMVLTDRFIEEWKKLIPLAPVFLNEIV